MLRETDNWDKFIVKKYVSAMKKNKTLLKDVFSKFNNKIVDIVRDIHNSYGKYIYQSSKKIVPEIIRIWNKANHKSLLSNSASPAIK